MSAKRIVVRILLVALIAAAGFYHWRMRHVPLAPGLISVDDNQRNMALAKIPKLSDSERAKTISDLLSESKGVRDSRSKRCMLFALRKLGASQPEVLALNLQALSDPDKSVRDEAAVSLGEFGDAAIPELFKMLPTSHGELQDQLVLIIERFKEKATPGWQKTLASNDPMLRLYAAEALHARGVLTGSMTPVLTKDMLSTKDDFRDSKAVRPRLAHLLEKIDPRRRELVDLGFDLKQPRPDIRYRAALFISEMTPPKIGAVESLANGLNDKDINVAARCAVGLVRIGLDKIERLKKTVKPRLASVTARAKAAKIEGFEDAVTPAVASYFKS